MTDHYFILGIGRDATTAEVKEAFRKLCLKYHPDKAVQTEHNRSRYVEICEAYKVLSSKDKRARYDRKLVGLPDDRRTFFAKLRDALYPELRSTYKGIYPWYAVFSFILVFCFALLFFHSSGNKQGQPTIAPLAVQDLSTSVAKTKPVRGTEVINTDTSEKGTGSYLRVDSQKVAVLEPAAQSAKDTPATATVRSDSSRQTEDKITSTLKSHTPWKISKVKATSGGKVQPYEEWDYTYYFKDKKLYITYKSDEYGVVSRNRIVIPAKDVQTVYFANNKIWISSRRKSIQIYNSFGDDRTTSEFFAVKVNAKDSRALESSLSQAFSTLRSQY